MKDDGRIWDRFANRYYRKPIANLEAYEEKLQVSREYFSPDANVLEFGCGTGGTAISHAPYVQHIHAIDVSSKMLEFAQQQITQTGVDNVTFEQASIESFQAPDASYDAILGLSILHLLNDRGDVLNKVRSLLKPDGVFISSTVCIADSFKMFKYIAPVGRALGLFPMVKVFSVEDLVADLESAGFNLRYQWQPDLKEALFLVAEKTAVESATSGKKDAMNETLSPQGNNTTLRSHSLVGS